MTTTYLAGIHLFNYQASAIQSLTLVDINRLKPIIRQRLNLRALIAVIDQSRFNNN